MMNHNHSHDHELLEQVERLLQTGEASPHELLNDLAGTIPQARPEFQQALETQLLAALASQTETTKDKQSTMQTNLVHDLTAKRHVNLAVPFTLVAALIAVMLAALLLMNLPSPETDPPGVFSAAQQNATATPVPTGFPTTIPLLLELTARAAETRATVLCDVMRMMKTGDVYEFPQDDSIVIGSVSADNMVEVRGFTLGSDGVPDWVRVQTLQSDDPLTGWIPADVFTSGGNCRQVLYAGSMSAGVYFLEPAVAQFTACPTKPLEVRIAPSEDAVVIQPIVPDAVLRIEGELTLNTGHSWLLINWQGIQGWIAGDALPVDCINMLSPNGVALLDKTAVQLSIVPTVEPPVAIALNMVTATPVPAIDPFALTATSIIEFATAQAVTSTPTPIPAAVEQRPGGDYQITLAITGPSEANIMPGDVVDVLAEFRYSANHVIWAQVADSLTVVEMNAITAAPTSSYAEMHVTLRTPELNTIEILRNLAQEGVPFALTHAG